MCCLQRHLKIQLSPQIFAILKIANQDFVVNCSSEMAGAKEMHRVQVRQIHTAGVGLRGIRTIFLVKQNTALTSDVSDTWSSQNTQGLKCKLNNPVNVIL